MTERDVPSRSKILWRCRRGVREMDLLFNEYVKAHFDRLDAAQKVVLEALLDEADLDIMKWIMNKTEPPRPDYRPILDTMRVLKEKQLESN